MSFIKIFPPFLVLALMLVSFSDCNRSEKTKDDHSGTDTAANVKHVGADSIKHDDHAANEKLDTINKIVTKQDSIQKKGPLPRPLEPRWTGGDHEAIQAFFKKHVKYPEEARKHNIAGTVYVIFTVKANGETDNFQVRKGLGYGCDEEAIRVIKLLGKWQPGKVGGKEVDMEYSLGVPFGEQ